MPEFDALRGVGGLTILGYHLWPSTVFLGWTRVDMFFVLSGCLVTSTMIKHGAQPGFSRTFWARRAIRILPAYYALLAVLCLKALVSGTPIHLGALASHVAFTQNSALYWSETSPRFLPGTRQTWSLAVEGQFYVLWPLVLLIGGRPLLAPAAALFAINSAAARWLGLYPAVGLSRCDGLAMGALLAILLAAPRAERPRSTWILLAAAVSGFLGLTVGFNHWGLEDPVRDSTGPGALGLVAVNATYAGLLGLIALHSGHPLLSPLRWSALRYLGRISYGIFLYHLAVISWVEECCPVRSPSRDLACVGLSLLAAAISWECLEKPIGRLNSRFSYGRLDPGGMDSPTNPRPQAIDKDAPPTWIEGREQDPICQGARRVP